MLIATVLGKPIIGAPHAEYSRSLSWSLPSIIKCTETITAVLSAILVTFTYRILIGAGSRMSNTSLLPMESIKRNINSILNQAWPDTSDSMDCGASRHPDAAHDAIRLLYMGKMKPDARTDRVARGVLQCEANPLEQHDEPRLWLTSGSPLTTVIVQLAIWEWVFLWIGMAMIMVTLLHNGFIVGPRAQDSFLRLSVVLAYLAAYIVHAIFVWQSCFTFFTNVAVGGAWSMLSRASFAIIDTAQDTSLDLQMIEKSSDAFGSAISTTSGQLLDAQMEFKAAMDTIHDMQTSERNKATIAGECALERIIASGMLLLSINISSGFLIWSTTTADEALGSLGLLSFLSLGIATMYTSAVQLTILNSAYDQIVYMKEIMINGQAVNFVKKRLPSRRVIGFTGTQKTVKPRRVSVWDFVRATSLNGVLCLLLFGPAYLLLPTEEDRDRTANRAKFKMSMMVRGHPVVLTTSNTNAHATDDDGGSWEAINVCYRPSHPSRTM